MEIKFDKTYLGKLGLVKITEIICLIIAFSTCESYRSGWGYQDDLSKYYVAITIIVCVIFVIWFTVNLLGLVEDINALVLSTAHLALGILIFAPSCIRANSTVDARGQTELKTSFAFGIISSLLIFIDAQLHILFAASQPIRVSK